MKNWNPLNYVIFEAITGSRLYGTAMPESDLDLRGICVPPLEVLLNPFNSFEQKDSFEDEDRVIYSLSKFVKLCADANPNIIEMLFIPEKFWKSIDKRGKLLLENKDLFLSKKIKHTFTGYAFSQLNDIKRHRQWFVNPPKEKPTRKMFGLSDSPKISGEGLQAVSNIAFDLLKEDFADEIRMELAYRDAKQKWCNFIAWREGRNPARKETEEKYGYDVKHAMHLFRLMVEGKNLLLNKKLVFPLEEREWLLEIRNGKHTYDEIIMMAEGLNSLFDLWYNESELPDSPNRKEIEYLYFNILGV